MAVELHKVQATVQPAATRQQPFAKGLLQGLLFILGLFLAWRFYAFQQVDDSLPYESAEAGDKEAQFVIGWHYMHQNDWKTAMIWFDKAAEQGHAKAQNNAGIAYMQGLGVAVDKVKGCAYLQAAYAKLQEAQIAKNVAICLDKQDQPQYRQVFLHFETAAKAGVSEAQRSLADMYEKGQGVKQDFRQAAYWYRQAVKQNNMLAAYSLALLYGRHGEEEEWQNLRATFILFTAVNLKASGKEKAQLEEVGFYKRFQKFKVEMSAQERQELEQVIAQSSMPKIVEMVDAIQPKWAREIEE